MSAATTTSSPVPGPAPRCPAGVGTMPVRPGQLAAPRRRAAAPARPCAHPPGPDRSPTAPPGTVNHRRWDARPGRFASAHHEDLTEERRSGRGVTYRAGSRHSGTAYGCLSDSGWCWDAPGHDQSRGPTAARGAVTTHPAVAASPTTPLRGGWTSGPRRACSISSRRCCWTNSARPAGFAAKLLTGSSARGPVRHMNRIAAMQARSGTQRAYHRRAVTAVRADPPGHAWPGASQDQPDPQAPTGRSGMSSEAQEMACIARDCSHDSQGRCHVYRSGRQ